MLPAEVPSTEALAVVMPTTRPAAVDQRPAGVAGVDGGVGPDGVVDRLARPPVADGDGAWPPAWLLGALRGARGYPASTSRSTRTPAWSLSQTPSTGRSPTSRAATIRARARGWACAEPTNT